MKKKKRKKQEGRKSKKNMKKIRKEAEKKYEQRLKELKQKEKEDKKKIENKNEIQINKEKEKKFNIQKIKEREESISPPYGFENYGNTCYFNSVNQILLNLPILQKIFLDKRINFLINNNNNLEKQGKFFDLFKSLYHIRKSKILSIVLTLKRLLGELKQDFNNKSQQDANEYLNILLQILHEGINLFTNKKINEINDDIYNNNTIEEVANFFWSYDLIRNASFIDSIFKFQLRSNLTCKRCNKIKYNFENNYILNLPVSNKKMINVEIYLYKLPFNYKLYYSEINPKFKEYIEQPKNKDKSIINNLWNYYIDELTIKDRKLLSEIIHFSFDINIKKNMIELIKI